MKLKTRIFFKFNNSFFINILFFQFYFLNLINKSINFLYKKIIFFLFFVNFVRDLLPRSDISIKFLSIFSLRSFGA